MVCPIIDERMRIGSKSFFSVIKELEEGKNFVDKNKIINRIIIK